MLLAALIPLIVIVIVGAFLATGWRAGGRPDLAAITITARDVVIRPVRPLGVLSFRKELRLRRDRIRGVSVPDRPSLPPRGRRAPGTRMPGLVAGTFRGPQLGTSFWLAGRASRLLRIDVRNGPFDCVILQIVDPDRIARDLSQPLPEGPRG